MSDHRFSVRLWASLGPHVRLGIWANGALAGDLTLTPEEADEFARRLEATTWTRATPCGRCGKQIDAGDVPDIGADGVTLYHYSCYRLAIRAEEAP